MQFWRFTVATRTKRAACEKLSSTRIRQVSDEALTEAAASADRPPGGIATLTRLPHAAVDSLPREGSGSGSISFSSFC
jgi:hypothetical protein